MLGPWVGAQTTAPAGPAEGTPQLELSSTLLDFGELWQGEPAKGEFTVKNVGTAPLTVALKSSCGCAMPTKPKSPLEPGESDTFTISYDTLKRRGRANQQVTVTTNDPNQTTVQILVRGNVKPLYTTDPPDEGLVFHGLTTDKVATRTIKFESKYDGPLHLKLKEGQDLRPFEVEFKEIEPGKKFELTATTKPPLNEDITRVQLVLETGLEKPPEISIPLHAHVRADVSCRPSLLRATRRSIVPMEQAITLVYRTDRPVRVTEVRPSAASIQYKLHDPRPERGSRDWTEQIIRLTLPPGDQLPPGNASVEILTSAENPRYQKFTVPIQIVEGTQPAAAPPENPPPEDSKPP